MTLEFFTIGFSDRSLHWEEQNKKKFVKSCPQWGLKPVADWAISPKRIHGKRHLAKLCESKLCKCMKIGTESCLNFGCVNILQRLQDFIVGLHNSSVSEGMYNFSATNRLNWKTYHSDMHKTIRINVKFGSSIIWITRFRNIQKNTNNTLDS